MEMFSVLGSRSCVRKEITCASPLTSNNGVFLGIPLILKEQKWRMTSTYKINFTNINIRKLLFEEVQAYVTDYKFFGGTVKLLPIVFSTTNTRLHLYFQWWSAYPCNHSI